MSSIPKITVIDAFAGAGGLSLGLKWAGLDLRCAFDANIYAVKTYRRNFKHPILHKRIEEITREELLNAAGLKEGEFDLLVGGPPCQGFSVRRRGEDKDPRNKLVLEFGRLIAELKPTFFLMENVPGLVGRRGKEYLESFKLLLNAEGYELHIAKLDASDFGVPQIRKRVFVVGEKIINGKTFFEFPGEEYKVKEKVTVRQALQGLPSPPDDFTEHPEIANHKRERTSKLNQLRISFVPQGGGREYIPEELQLECHKRASVEKAGHRYSYGRLAWDEPAATITARFDSFTRGKFAHPEENRTITLREGARLQTFPDDFVFEGPKVEVAKQIGNAVPPLLGKVLGLSIIEAFKKRRSEL